MGVSKRDKPGTCSGTLIAVNVPDAYLFEFPTLSKSGELKNYLKFLYIKRDQQKYDATKILIKRRQAKYWKTK